MNILDKIIEKTKERVKKINLKNLELKLQEVQIKKDFPFKKALVQEGGIKIIAEIKKASPSKGLIAADFDPAKTAKEYKEADVDCISVLTEPYFFHGDNSYIGLVKKISGKPILRKDFIISKEQIIESKLIGADCILLICSILDDKKLSDFLSTARTIGLCALVEAHDEKEIKMALNSGAEIIGVNNRNLKTFEIDFNNSLRLKKSVPKDIIFVSESGIKTREDIKKLESAGVNAVLIGETFMKSNDKVSVIQNLRGF